MKAAPRESENNAYAKFLGGKQDVLWASDNGDNRPFPSSPGPLYQNEVKCSASHANKPHFHINGFALSLILNVRVFGTRK